MGTHAASGYLVLLGILVALCAVFLGLLAWAVFDMFRRPEWQFEAVEQNRWLWLGAVLALPALGLPAYAVVAVTMLRPAAKAGEEEFRKKQAARGLTGAQGAMMPLSGPGHIPAYPYDGGAVHASDALVPPRETTSGFPQR